jgi:sulfur-carrier protein
VPRIVFTSNLQRHVDCPSAAVEGNTVRAALEAYFAEHAKVQSYILDEQGTLRKHVVIFVDGRQLRDRVALSETVEPATEIYVMQALSGG